MFYDLHDVGVDTPWPMDGFNYELVCRILVLLYEFSLHRAAANATAGEQWYNQTILGECNYRGVLCYGSPC